MKKELTKVFVGEQTFVSINKINFLQTIFEGFWFFEIKFSMLFFVVLDLTKQSNCVDYLIFRHIHILKSRNNR